MSTQEYFIDGRVLVNGRKGHLHLGFPIKFSDILASVYTLLPQLNANPYYFFNGISTSPNITQGTDVTLGGLLTQNTTIDGNSLYDFTFQNILNFTAQSNDILLLTVNDLELNSGQDLLSNVFRNSINIVGGSIYNQTTDIENVVSDTLQNTVTNLIQNQTSRYNTEVNDEFRFANEIFGDCNNLDHELVSVISNNSFQLGSYDGYRNTIRGSFTVPSSLDPMIDVSAACEAGFYIFDNYNDNCTPRVFINSYSIIQDTDTIENSSLIELNPDAVSIKVINNQDAGVDDIANILIEGSSMEYEIRNNTADREASFSLDEQYFSVRHQSGVITSDYKLPGIGNPNDGEIMVMDNNRIARFTRFEYLVTSRDIATLASGDYVIIPISFDPLVDFEYYLDRVYISGESGVDGDSLQFFIQDFAEQAITAAPVIITLGLTNIHPSEPGLFYTSTSDANLNTCIHDGQPTMWLMRFTSGAATWTNCKITFTFKLKSR